jgi:hypothetical protein
MGAKVHARHIFWRSIHVNQTHLHLSWKYGGVFGGLVYPHDLSHDLSERTVYIPSASLCCCNQQRAITPSDHGVLVTESLIKDSLFVAIQQRLSRMSNIINCPREGLANTLPFYIEVNCGQGYSSARLGSTQLHSAQLHSAQLSSAWLVRHKLIRKVFTSSSAVAKQHHILQHDW